MIRFQRIGRKNDAAFRIAVLEKASGPKAGKYVDLVGTYNPKTKAFTAQGDRIKDWISKGAQLSPSVQNLLINKGVLEGKKLNVLPKKTPIKKPEEAAPAAAPAEEAPAAEAPAEEAVVEETPAAEAAPEPVAVVEETPAPAEDAPTEEVAA
ncbi:30S ribosomal protein S16 [Patescibacteria group bacterium]|nr:30S ribosomal protein S16 [Patescibacteria group bacterium]